MLRVGPAGGPPPLLTLTDLGSTNGTYVGRAEGAEGQNEGENASALKAMVAVGVNAGDEVVFGDMFLARFRVVAGDAVGGGAAAA
jgi:pSer/pThr/pTyr-binding forkhead associated (FHA) protein